MKKFKVIAFALISTGIILGIDIYRKTYSAEFTTAIIRTTEGAQVHKKIDGTRYGKAIDEDFVIHAPPGKYMRTSNIRVWILTQIICLAVGYFFLAISFRKDNYRNRRQSKNQKES